jgi:predicted deacylase
MIGLPETYEQSRSDFQAALVEVQKLWPSARLTSHSLPGQPDLTMDWISADALQTRNKLLILTAGEHGIEGYAGSVMLQLFINEFMPRLNPASTGLLLVHCINPWGMQHRRRTNASNVDLNRNFVQDFSNLQGANPDYDLVFSLLNPTRPMKFILWEKILFTVQAVGNLAHYGMSRLREATLRGQFKHPQGIYYGGMEMQEETRRMVELFNNSIQSYRQLLMLDMHTGYGPKALLTLVSSAQERMSSAQMVARFKVPLVAAANPQEFYSIQGDMIEYIYTLMQSKYPDTKFFAATFEFGTLGNSISALIRSLYTTVFENRLYWHGGSQPAQRWVQGAYDALFAPRYSAWNEQAQADGRQAFEGILKAEEYI